MKNQRSVYGSSNYYLRSKISVTWIAKSFGEENISSIAFCTWSMVTVDFDDRALFFEGDLFVLYEKNAQNINEDTSIML